MLFMLIHYIKQHMYSHRSLITKVLTANAIDLTGADSIEGARGIVEKPPLVKKPRTTRPKAQRKINLEPVEEEAVEEENEDTMTLNQILKQSPPKTRIRL